MFVCVCGCFFVFVCVSVAYACTCAQTQWQVEGRVERLRGRWEENAGWEGKDRVSFAPAEVCEDGNEVAYGISVHIHIHTGMYTRPFPGEY